MPYPDDFNSAALDAAMGRDEDAAAAPMDCYDAARSFLYALDRGWLTIDRPNSGFIAGMREAVAAERDARAADEAERRAAVARMRAGKQGVA